jgi:hypothetical protein
MADEIKFNAPRHIRIRLEGEAGAHVTGNIENTVFYVSRVGQSGLYISRKDYRDGELQDAQTGTVPGNTFDAPLHDYPTL